MTPQLTTTQWLALPMEVRLELKKIFGIPRSEGTMIQDNRVLSDGHNHNDLSRITVESMQQFTGSDSTDFFNLLNDTLNLVDNKLRVEEVTPPPAPEPKVIMLTVGGKMYAATEVGVAEIGAADNASPLVAAPAPDNAPLYPVQPAPVVAKVRKARGPNKKK